MIIQRKKRFIKSYSKLQRKAQDAFDESLLIFEKNPRSPILRNHALHGEYAGFRSIDVSGDIRAIFREFPDGTYEFVEFIDIGSHNQLY